MVNLFSGNIFCFNSRLLSVRDLDDLEKELEEIAGGDEDDDGGGGSAAVVDIVQVKGGGEAEKRFVGVFHVYFILTGNQVSPVDSCDFRPSLPSFPKKNGAKNRF